MNGNLLIRRRTIFLFFLLGSIFLVLGLRVAWIQLVRGEELQKEALDNRLQSVEIEAKRGVIYDRNGKELAISVDAPSIGVWPPIVKRSGKEKEIAEQLSEVLEMDKNDVLERLSRQTMFSWIKRKVPFEKGDKIKQLDLPGVHVIQETQRFYPKGRLACHLLGFAGIDNQGLTGLELQYGDVLSGKPGKIVIEKDAAGREIPQATHEFIPPKDGNSIVLTIDESIQYFVERELDNLINSPTDPKECLAIVMDVKSGEILAMASRPNFDPNHFGDFSSKVYRNIAVNNSFEPGSTFKIVTASAALEEGVVSVDEHFYDPGYIKFDGGRIRCWRSGRPHGRQTFAEGVMNSCNPVFVEVGLRLEKKGEGTFYKYIRSFGFGKPTGIDFPGEANGILINEENLKPINIATISIGQGISVTPLQLINMAATVANSGVMVRPHLLKEIRDPEGKVIEKITPQNTKQVISQETAQKVSRLLEKVVEEGTGKNAYIAGYRVGGKTGTAQKVGKGGYQSGSYIASFLGFAPVDDPEVAILVVVDEPKGVYYGGQVAAPVFRNIMEDTLRYLGVPRELPEGEEEGKGERPEEKVVVPNVYGFDREKAERVLKNEGLKPSFVGSGPKIISQSPKGSAEVRKETEVILYTGSISAEGKIEKVTVPDLTGKRIWEASAILEALDLSLKAEGTGEAREQRPTPGEVVSPGTEITVIFKEPPAQEVLSP